MNTITRATKTTLAIACLTLAVVATAQTSSNPPTPSLTVSGTSEMRVEPDLATIRIGVTTQAKTAAQAQDAANRRAQAFIDDVKALLKGAGTVETGRISLYPVYTERQPMPNEVYVPQIAGYRAENTLVVRTSDFRLVGPVVDTAVKAGLNTVESIVFSLKDDTESRLKALNEAVRQARRKAEAMAEGAGVEITGVWEIHESSARVIPYMAEAAMARMDAAPTPVIPGAVELRADVSVRFFIRPRTR